MTGKPDILVMAAFGNQGRLLLPKLAAKGARVRGLRATAGGEDALLALGAVDAVSGDAADPAVLARALDGIRTVYHIGPGGHPQERAMGFAMVEAAAKAGVEHFIYSSVLHPIIEDMVQHRLKREVEAAIVTSGLNFTILQPSDYMQVVFYQEAFRTGVYRRWWNVDRREALVDLEDVTDVAARVITEGAAHHGATYELSSGDCLTGAQIAAAIGRVMGREVRLEEITAEDFLTIFFGAAKEDPRFAYTIDMLRAMNHWYGAHDLLGNANVLTMLLGRRPNSFEDVLRRDYGEMAR